MCYHTAVPPFHISEKKENGIRNASAMSLYLPILPFGLSRKLEALMFTTGAFFCDYSGIGILGIARRYLCSFGSYSVFGINGISFRSFCSR